jgi:adhesin transport system outer membrane protein|uniref:Outer membrane efflux protein n=2 Tax=environmental samples TaxID=48479 RepID=A0A126SXN8_9BACT|nr:outer membrane efflux protein [uncultured bacterium UPO37]AMK59644.1 outer membrane efflux protein [uncultured bacterium UPO89]
MMGLRAARGATRGERGFWMAGLAGLFLVTAAGSGAAAQSIDEAMALAVENHPAVKAQKYQADAADQDVGTARSGYFPTLSIDGSVRSERTKQPYSERTMTPQDYSATLTQPLFDGLATPARVSVAKANAQAEKFDTRSERNDVALDAAKAYLDVLEAREKLELMKGHEAHARSIADRISKRVAVDSGLRSLTVVSHSETEQAQFLVLDAQRELAIAETEYRELVGQNADAMVEPAEPVDIGTLNDEEAIERAASRHPALASAQSRARAFDAEKDVARSTFFPHLYAEAQARNARNIDGVRGPDNDYYVGLRLTYNFSTGGGDFHTVNAADYREQAAAMQIQDVARKIRVQVLEALQNFRSNRSTHAVLVRRKLAAADLVRVYDAQFVGGQRDLLDLFYVLNEQRVADVEELKARFDTLRAAYGVMAAMGELGGQTE